MLRQIIATALLCLSPLAAQADENLVSLERLDQVRDWRAVGLLEIGSTGSCTGTLIEPDLVLTAAHCLVREDGRRHSPDTITFRAAFQNGRQAASVRGVAMAVPPEYDPLGHRIDNGFAVDVALLRLAYPILRTQVSPFSVVSLIRSDEDIAVVSYGQGRNDAPSLQRECHLLGREEGMVVMDCSATFGSSGAPIFVLRNGGPRVASVLTGTFTDNGQQLSVGVSLDEILPALRRQINGLSGSIGSEAGASVTMIRPGERSNTGARFVQVEN